MDWKLFEIVGCLLLVGVGTYFLFAGPDSPLKDEWWDDVHEMD